MNNVRADEIRDNSVWKYARTRDNIAGEFSFRIAIILMPRLALRNVGFLCRNIKERTALTKS